MIHNEDSRVKIPTILHLMRLGYTYLSLKGQNWDESTNVFIDIFNEQIQRINPEASEADIRKAYQEMSLCLENEDLGRAFYEKLIDRNGLLLIDFENFNNNSFHVATELPCKKDEEEFRPDVTLLINGMPLVFIEVKKPNNLDGIQAEHKRMARRFQNKKFRKFINMTQLMVFSNNMEYDNESSTKLQGAFYASTSYKRPSFNYFREEEEFDINRILSDLTDDQELEVLKDTNLLSIRHSKEFQTNKEPNSPTNRMCTSLFQRNRLAFLLRYAIAYVNESKGLEKHIMRYPQIFATKAIENKLEEGTRKGIIWHTQGSGKTALAYYNVKHLTDYFAKKSVIPKFYFIVDRLDLATQAKQEFTARDLVVHVVNSRHDFSQDIKATKAIHNDSGKAEITVVNIQKFKDDPDVVSYRDYQVNIQRIYFLDEVHRSYNPKGSFLANLETSDPNAIKIGLTGTPLLGTEYNSKTLFGGYIHKYYYNASIADGYTLRLIREEIETSYKLMLQKTLEDIAILKGNVKSTEIYAHPAFVEPMLKYIINDFEASRLRMNDNTIGGMVVCDSSDQAKEMYAMFQRNYAVQNIQQEEYAMAAEPGTKYHKERLKDRKVQKVALILHDVGTKKERKDWVDEFKDGKTDMLFVFNMLLTGFDAKRLKKLYIGRVIRSHNLLQTLTRVNRTYKDFRYGYVVDFADIEKEFERTNQDYFKELQDELGDEIQHYSDLFKSQEEIAQEIEEIKDVLFKYDTENAENFSRQISQISDRGEMLKIVKALNNAKSLYNLIRLSGQFEMLEKLDFRMLNVLSREAEGHLALINQKEALESSVDTSNLLNIALEDVLFTFTKVKEGEMILADQLKDILQRTREMLGGNFDPRDPEFVSLREELERLFKKKNLSDVSKQEMEENIVSLESIYERGKKLERENQLLRAKYDNDEKYARVHKRLMEKDPLTEKESKLYEALKGLKAAMDEHIMNNSEIMENENYVEKMLQRLVIEQFKNTHNIPMDLERVNRLKTIMMKEYMNEYNGRVA